MRFKLSLKSALLRLTMAIFFNFLSFGSSINFYLRTDLKLTIDDRLSPAPSVSRCVLLSLNSSILYSLQTCSYLSNERICNFRYVILCFSFDLSSPAKIRANIWQLCTAEFNSGSFKKMTPSKLYYDPAGFPSFFSCLGGTPSEPSTELLLAAI